MTSTKDCYDREVNVGDYLIYSHSSRYLNMYAVLVTGITPKGGCRAVQARWSNAHKILIPKPMDSCFKVDVHQIPTDVAIKLREAAEAQEIG